jgi:hypothetical protein
MERSVVRVRLEQQADLEPSTREVDWDITAGRMTHRFAARVAMVDADRREITMLLSGNTIGP